MGFDEFLSDIMLKHDEKFNITILMINLYNQMMNNEDFFSFFETSIIIYVHLYWKILSYVI